MLFALTAYVLLYCIVLVPFESTVSVNLKKFNRPVVRRRRCVVLVRRAHILLPCYHFITPVLKPGQAEGGLTK